MKRQIILLIIFYTIWSPGEHSVAAKRFSLAKDDKHVNVVVIDAGHGGKDTGASSNGVHEKDIVLAVALKLGEKIKAAYPEIKLIYTRKSDVFIPLYQRADIANKNKADLFISIHANSINKPYVNGAETFVLGQHRSADNLEVAKTENAVILLEDDYNTTYEGFDPNSPESYIMFELVQDEYLEQSVLLASAIQKQFTEKAKRLDRSVKQAGFLVLRRTTMPSVLVETGFISNSNERSYMQSEKGKDELATAIFTAFSEYKTKIENKSLFALVTEKATSQPVLPTENNSKAYSSDVDDKLTFAVQLAASSKKLKTNAANFKGVKKVFRKNYGNIYRYFTGTFNSYEEAQAEKNRLTSKFPDAFVVAFKNDVLISVKMPH